MFNWNVLDMPVPAGIFAMNKIIANIHKIHDMVSYHSQNIVLTIIITKERICPTTYIYNLLHIF